jgi:hypothetical protein
LGGGTANFTAGGYAAHPDVCRTLIGLSFRRMLARADLRERPDAKPGPPHRDPPEATGPSQPSPPYDHDADRRLGGMIRIKRRVGVRSSELTIGVLSRSTHGEETWTWTLTGVHRPDDDPDFVWHDVAAASEQDPSTRSRNTGRGGSIGPVSNKSSRSNVA